MSESLVVLVTGAGRGMGVDIARAALDAGHRVVATARDADRVTKALGASDDLLAVSLDVTDPASVQAGVNAAVERFGRLDVLVNNAGNFYAGFFEEITPDDFRAQLDTNLFGPLNVTRAVLPGDARAALRDRGDDQLHGGADRRRVHLGLRRLQVRP
jgi:NAD(P)-dependent dehydrogenase (short-subunit alcohol dehydrogenase family)